MERIALYTNMKHVNTSMNHNSQLRKNIYADLEFDLTLLTEGNKNQQTIYM